MRRWTGVPAKLRRAVIGACGVVALLPAAAAGGPAWSVTPVLVVPSDIPRGRVEGEKRLLLGEMTLARDWYAAALGRSISMNLQGVGVVYSTNPESYFAEPNTWFYRVVDDVNAAGYTHGTTSSPQIIVGMVVGGRRVRGDEWRTLHRGRQVCGGAGGSARRQRRCGRVRRGDDGGIGRADAGRDGGRCRPARGGHAFGVAARHAAARRRRPR